MSSRRRLPPPISRPTYASRGRQGTSVRLTALCLCRGVRREGHSTNAEKTMFLARFGRTHLRKFSPWGRALRSHRQPWTRQCSFRAPVGHPELSLCQSVRRPGHFARPIRRRRMVADSRDTRRRGRGSRAAATTTLPLNRGQSAPSELFMASVWGWESHLRRRM
jgi:hypothetical protein